MGLFKKSVKSSSAANADESASSSDEIESNTSVYSNSSLGVSSLTGSESVNLSNLSKSLSSMMASIDRLNAESLATKEVRTVTNDRFAKISEELGELKTMLRANEKSISIIEAKVEKAVGLIDAVQPQMLLSTVNKVDFKLEALKSKVEANELIYNKVREDIRDLRNKFMVFRNLEMIKEMNEDSKSRFKDLRKIEMEVIKHSDRVESMFNEIEKSIKDSKENTKGITDISQSLKSMLLSVDKFKSDLSLKISRDELRKLQESIDKNKNDIIDVVAKDFEDYKRKALHDIEMGVRQEEIRSVNQLISDNLKKSGVNLESLGSNDKAVRMILFMNMRLFAKNYLIDEKKMGVFKNNPYAFTVSAYIAMRLKESDTATVKKELISMGFDSVKIEKLLDGAKLLEKIF